MKRVTAVLIVIAVAVVSAQPATGSAAPLFTLHASAGFVSPEENLTVYSDGTAVVQSGRDPALRVRLPRPAVRQMQALFERLHFKSLRPYYGPARTTDTPAYDLTYGGKTVRTESGTPPAPERLWTLVAQLEGVIDEARHPFVVQLRVTGRDGLAVTLMGDRTALIDTGTGPTSRRLTRSCFRRLRTAAHRLRTGPFAPGIITLAPRNPPASLELTRAFSSFHMRLRKPMPPGAARLIARARSAAGARCRA